MKKTSTNIKFEENKSTMIKLMYSSILDKRKAELEVLQTECKEVKEKNLSVLRNIKEIENETRAYKKKIHMLESFQNFLSRNQ